MAVLIDPISPDRRGRILAEPVPSVLDGLRRLAESGGLSDGVRHSDAYVGVVASLAENAREVAAYFAVRSPALTATKQGAGALLFEAYLIERQRELFERFVETQADGDHDDFLAVFEGMIQPDEFDRLAEGVRDFCDVDILLSAGQATHDEISDLTILRCKPKESAIKAADALRENPPMSIRAVVAPITSQEYRKVANEGGLTHGAFKRLFPDAPDDTGTELMEYRDANGVPWYGCESMGWKPDYDNRTVELMTESRVEGLSEEYDSKKPRKIRSGMPSKCGKPIKIGAPIYIVPTNKPGKKAVHVKCFGGKDESVYESRPPRGTPSIRKLVDELKDAQADLRPQSGRRERDDQSDVDVRLQVVDGRWTLHVGDAPGDNDRRGAWGTGVLTASMDDEDLRELARELIDDLRNSSESTAATLRGVRSGLVRPGRTSDVEDDGDSTVVCPLCSQPQGEDSALGVLGYVKHYRCRNCGGQFSHKLPRGRNRPVRRTSEGVESGFGSWSVKREKRGSRVRTPIGTWEIVDSPEDAERLLQSVGKVYEEGSPEHDAMVQAILEDYCEDRGVSLE